MAFYRTGGFVLKSVKPLLINPSFIVPSSVNLQVRHAARKGYREKKQKKSALLAQSASMVKEVSRIKTKYSKVEKTVNQKKPEPPNDDVFITDLFNYKKYTLSEAVTLHREYHHPEVYNNPTAPVSLRIEINMTGKRSTQFIKPFSGVASIPHPFVISHKKEVLVLCNPEDAKEALDAGAAIAGGVDVVKKIQEGVIQPVLYEYIIAHTNFLPQLTPVRTLLKDKLPKARVGTLTNDLKAAVNRFVHGIEYSCVRIGTEQDFGIIDCYVGKINMELHELEENFRALIADIETNRPPRDGDFITWVWCSSKPSNEEFCIDMSKYIKQKAVDVDDEDDDDVVLTEKQREKLAVKKLLGENTEEEEVAQSQSIK